MSPEVFFVDKVNFFDDTLVAFGFGRLLTHLLQTQVGNDHTVDIVDKGSYYQFQCKPTLLANDFSGIPLFYPVKLVRFSRKNSGLPESISEIMILDSNEQWEKARIRQASGEAEKPEKLDEISAVENLEAAGMHNRLILAWLACQTIQPEIINLILQMLSQTPNRKEWAETQWAELNKKNELKIESRVSRLQFLNPSSGKGQISGKMKLVTPTWSEEFWLIEFLKLVGFYEVGFPRTVVRKKGQKSGDKDRKTFVIAPRELTLVENHAIMSKFREAMVEEYTSVTFDVLAAIRYTRTLLKYYSEDKTRIAQLLNRSKVKRRVVAGFYAVFYKKLGRAFATTNISFIGLPGWIEVQNREDVAMYLDLLDEIEKIVWQFDESLGEDFALLQLLRDFLSGDNLNSFLKFANTYASYCMSLGAKNRTPRLLSFDFVERIVFSMGQKYADIADITVYPGFHNIARAIAESTVIPQQFKGNSPFKIRYGLNQELTRYAHNPEQFLEKLSEFIHTYNAETSRAHELGRGFWREKIESKDIDDILRMLQDFNNNSRMVAQLLVAYGYTDMRLKKLNLSESEIPDNG